MRRISGIAAALLALLAVPGFGAKVINVELSFVDGSTVATINIDGVVRFTHQTEVPKDGRPNRVILDVLAATHELGAKNFMNLPDCPVSGIRTSQYSVTPEKIVRIVFDLTSTPMYRIKSDSKSISVIFSGKNQHAFAFWSSGAIDKVSSKPKANTAIVRTTNPASKSGSSSLLTVAQRNKKIDDDRLVSLGSTKPSSLKKVSSTSATSDKSLAVISSSETSSSDKSKSSDARSIKPSGDADKNASAGSLLANKQKQNSSAGKSQAVKSPATPTQAKVAVKSTGISTQAKAAVKNSGKTENKGSIALKGKKSPSRVAVPTSKKSLAKKEVVVAIPKETSSKNAAVVSIPSKKVKSKQSKSDKVSKVATTSKSRGKVTAKKNLVSKASNKAKPTVARQNKTSRFRRNTNNAKMKRTMVAEFPKRLVIKYKARGRRDPFASLLDESRTYNSPIEQRIPNIEGTRLVGIIESENGSNRALLEDKEGYGYILKSGDKVRNGYVLRVENDKVYFQIFEYGWSRTIALSIY